MTDTKSSAATLNIVKSNSWADDSETPPSSPANSRPSSPANSRPSSPANSRPSSPTDERPKQLVAEPTVSKRALTYAQVCEPRESSSVVTAATSSVAATAISQHHEDVEAHVRRVAQAALAASVDDNVSRQLSASARRHIAREKQALRIIANGETTNSSVMSKLVAEMRQQIAAGKQPMNTSVPAIARMLPPAKSSTARVRHERASETKPTLPDQRSNKLPNRPSNKPPSKVVPGKKWTAIVAGAAPAAIDEVSVLAAPASSQQMPNDAAQPSSSTQHNHHYAELTQRKCHCGKCLCCDIDDSIEQQLATGDDLVAPDMAAAAATTPKNSETPTWKGMPILGVMLVTQPIVAMPPPPTAQPAAPPAVKSQEVASIKRSSGDHSGGKHGETPRMLSKHGSTRPIAVCTAECDDIDCFNAHPNMFGSSPQTAAFCVAGSWNTCNYIHLLGNNTDNHTPSPSRCPFNHIKDELTYIAWRARKNPWWREANKESIIAIVSSARPDLSAIKYIQQQ